MNNLFESHTVDINPSYVVDTHGTSLKSGFEAYSRDRWQMPDYLAISAENFPVRNALVRVVLYKLLRGTTWLLGEATLPPKAAERNMVSARFNNLGRYYQEESVKWETLLQEIYGIGITWTRTGFEARNTETGEKIVFPRDDDLLNEALKELNYYKEKCDLVNYFQIENYPMFLLSILRSYDVNLELDQATNKYALAPGPTDPQRFFDIVAEFTFVNDPSDIEYLKQNLRSWKD